MRKSDYVPTKKYAELTPGDRIRIACELLEIPQKEIARRASLHPTHLSEIIHGKRNIGLNVALRLSKVLNIPVARLIGEDEKEDIRRKEVELHLERIKKCIRKSHSIGEDTERILLEEIDEAIDANRECA